MVIIHNIVGHLPAYHSVPKGAQTDGGLTSVVSSLHFNCCEGYEYICRSDRRTTTAAIYCADDDSSFSFHLFHLI
jgi:hypothetical protein